MYMYVHVLCIYMDVRMLDYWTYMVSLVSVHLIPLFRRFCSPGSDQTRLATSPAPAAGCIPRCLLKSSYLGVQIYACWGINYWFQSFRN